MPARKNYKKKPRPTRKNQRKKQAIMRMPFVEQKRRESTGYFNLNSTATTWIPDAFEFTEQGDTAATISGRWLYSKWLTVNALFDFTGNTTDTVPLSYRVMHGWCKVNLNPNPTEASPGPINLDPVALTTHVGAILNAAYEKPLAFGDMRRIKLLSNQYINSNPRILEKDVAGSFVPQVFRANQIKKYKWTIQRKIRYNHMTFGDPETPYMQCNSGNWVPFIHFIKNPTGATPSAAFPKFSHNSIHYFTDA
jgi:hypothetical protein